MKLRLHCRHHNKVDQLKPNSKRLVDLVVGKLLGIDLLTANGNVLPVSFSCRVGNDNIVWVGMSAVFLVLPCGTWLHVMQWRCQFPSMIIVMHWVDDAIITSWKW